MELITIWLVGQKSLAHKIICHISFLSRHKSNLVKVNKLSYIIINRYKFLLLKIFVALLDEANKYCCCQFNAKTCSKYMLRETFCEYCQPMNEVFYRNRCFICHFKLALCNIRKPCEKIVKSRKSG